MIWLKMITLPQWKDAERHPKFPDGWPSKWRKYAGKHRVDEEVCRNQAAFMGLQDVVLFGSASADTISMRSDNDHSVSSSQFIVPAFVSKKRHIGTFHDFADTTLVDQTNQQNCLMMEFGADYNARSFPSLLLGTIPRKKSQTYSVACWRR